MRLFKDIANSTVKYQEKYGVHQSICLLFDAAECTRMKTFGSTLTELAKWQLTLMLAEVGSGKQNFLISQHSLFGPGCTKFCHSHTYQ